MANPTSAARRALVRARLLVNRAGYDVVREPFRHRFMYGIEQHGISTVLDIGANAGQFGTALRRAGFAGRIISVEPLRQAFAELSATAAGDRMWTVERAAVSDRPGTVIMNVSANSVSSSVLPMLDRHRDAAPQTRYVATEEVPAVTVDDLVARHEVAPGSALLKIDVQGYERQVLDGAAASLPRFAGLRTEMSLVPLYDGQALLPEMVSYLAARDLDLWYVEPGFTEPGTRRLLQLDGIFFRRRSTAPPSIPPPSTPPPSTR